MGEEQRRKPSATTKGEAENGAPLAEAHQEEQRRKPSAASAASAASATMKRAPARAILD